MVIQVEKKCGFIKNGGLVYNYHLSYKRDSMDKAFFQRTGTRTR